MTVNSRGNSLSSTLGVCTSPVCMLGTTRESHLPRMIFANGHKLKKSERQVTSLPVSQLPHRWWHYFGWTVEGLTAPVSVQEEAVITPVEAV